MSDDKDKKEGKKKEKEKKEDLFAGIPDLPEAVFAIAG